METPILDAAIARRRERMAKLARSDDGGDTHAESNRLTTELRALEALRENPDA